MRFQNLRAFIFDVDGTLVDSNELHVEAWVEAFRHFDIDMPADTIRGQIGKGGDLLVPDLLDARTLRRVEDDLSEFRKNLFLERYLDRVRPFPGVADIVRAIAGSGVSVALASSAGEDEVDHHINSLGLRNVLAAVTSKSDVETSKPAPDVFEAACEKLNIHDDAIVVGDTPYDILAAHRLRLPVLAVRSGGFPDDRLAAAEFLLDSVTDIPQHAKELDDWFKIL